MPDGTRTGVRLGVDVGSVRIGVARSDPSGLLATPVETLRRTAADDRVAAIADLAREHEAIEVVVGLPRSLSGAHGRAAEDVLAYATKLAQVVRPIPVRVVDERLTTVTAHQALSRSGRSGRTHRSVVDQVAAVLILQTALDTERGTGRPAGTLVEPAAGEGDEIR
ncbi:Holliday junction resolvase RuvX [Actinotalea caeni]|uniref:Holliday junction resolvase RuvX n=1 Tax=Actinotalea caeni TaxID=1348467 RepID=UPI0012E132BC|nr:Holliday junction resolvase RuvX [Actinotalea caeni]